MWTRKSYDALYDWLGTENRPRVKKILLADGLDDVVARLEAAATLGEWYKITHEAVAAVGPGIVEASAMQAERSLNRIADRQLHCAKCGYGWIPKTEAPRQCPNCKSMKWDKVKS